MPSSKYWSSSHSEVRKLMQENKRLSKEIEMLRQRDILKASIKRQKTEKFYRSPAGQAVTGISSAFRSLEKQATKPETKRAVSKLSQDFQRLGKKLLK